MAKILDVSSITEQIRARIAQLEEQLKQQRTLNDELDRLRGALARLEGEVRSRVAGKIRRRSTPSATAQPEAPATRSGSAAPKRTATSTRTQAGKKSAARGTIAKSGRATTRAPQDPRGAHGRTDDRVRDLAANRYRSRHCQHDA